MKIRSVYTIAAIVPLFLFLVTNPLKGQNGNILNTRPLNASSNIGLQSISDQQETDLKELYSSKVETPKEFLNGKEYESYYSRVKAKPLLFYEKNRSASIITKTRQYNNLTLQYDTYLDEVIYSDTSRTLNFRFPQIALNKDIVDEFYLYFEDDILHFINYREPEASLLNLKEGFYELVYESGCIFVIRHESAEYLREGRKNYKYSPGYYISSGEKFSTFKNRKTFLRLFGNKTEDVKRFIKTAGIKVGRADKSQIVSILKFYDSLAVSGK
jgi:hypothetical protein